MTELQNRPINLPVVISGEERIFLDGIQKELKEQLGWSITITELVRSCIRLSIFYVNDELAIRSPYDNTFMLIKERRNDAKQGIS